MSDGSPAPGRAKASWRPDDIVAYEEMRDLAVAVQTLLIAKSRRSGDGAGAARDAAAVRRETLAVDGFDRKAVDTQTRHLAEQLAHLRAAEAGDG